MKPPPETAARGTEPPGCWARTRHLWSDFWAFPCLSTSYVVGCVAWLLAFVSFFCYWYTFTSVANNNGATYAGGFLLAEVWMCSSGFRTNTQPASSCSQYELSVGPVYLESFRTGGAAAAGFIIVALVSIGLATILLRWRRSGELQRELAFCFSPPIQRRVASLAFPLHLLGVLWLFLAWTVYAGSSSAGYGDGSHFRSATVGGLDLSSHGLGPGFGLAVAAWLLEIAVAVLAFFAEPGPEAPRASGGPDWQTMGRATTPASSGSSAYGGGGGSSGGCGGCFGRSSPASPPGARGGRMATVENPLRTAALAGMGGAGAPRLPPPSSSAASGPHQGGADAEAGGATATPVFPGSHESPAAYDARSEAEVAGYRGADPPSHVAASSPRLPPPVLAALGLGDGPGPAAVASLPRPASHGVARDVAATTALQPHDHEGHGSDRAAFDDVEGVARTHVDETW